MSKEYRCTGCGKEGREGHTCPYAQELHNNDAECHCCSGCTQDCANDI